MPQSQWDRPVPAERLLIGAVLVIGARIVAAFLDPGWLKAFCEALLPMSGSLIIGVLINERAFLTGRRIAAIPVLGAVLATVFEVDRRWGWMAAAPLFVLTFVLVVRAVRSGFFGPRPIEPPPVLPTESSR